MVGGENEIGQRLRCIPDDWSITTTTNGHGLRLDASSDDGGASVGPLLRPARVLHSTS